MSLLKLQTMPSGKILKPSTEVVSETVRKTRVLVDRLRCAIIRQDNLTKECFDANSTELSETVESIKKSYLKVDKEYQSVKEEIQAGEKRLNDILEELRAFLEENARLKDVEDGFLNSKSLADENGRLAKELKETLRAYKLLTGVRFDFNDSGDVLTGYDPDVAVSGNKPSKSTIIPFEICTNNGNEKRLLWDEINEANFEISKFGK